MITCKEDLMNTYIENDFGELRDLYLAICNKYGLHCYHDGSHPKLQWSKWNYGQEMYYDDLWGYCCLSRGE